MIDFESAPTSGSGRKAEYTPKWLADAPESGLESRTPSGETPAFIEGLNDKQREASTTTEGPLIVLAGAGSGKTKMLTARISYLIDSLGVPAHHILAVTFTNKAAAEMRERVEKMLNLAANSFAPRWGGNHLGAPELGTFHSVCVRLLRRELDRTPFTKPFVIYDDSDQLSLVKSTMEKLGIDDKSFNPKAIQGGINRVKCDALEPHELEPASHDIFQRQLRRVYEQYQKELFANNALDFGEILCMAYRILRDHEDVRAKYQNRWKYIHVDEYQDTNRAQYLMLTMLASAKHGGHQNICVVGDEDQSIYKWRGADINNILDFENDYPGAKVVKLEQNYRSTKTIITAASQVISNNRTRKDKTLWTDNEEGLPIVRSQLPDERGEAEFAVSEIKRLAENEGRAYRDFAIFYRTNAQSRQFEDVLRREKIPYQVVGGLRFYDRKEIKDVLSYFRVILNPTDSVSLKRIVNVPARGIGKTTLDKIEQHQRELPEGSSYWDALLAASKDPSITSAATAKKLAAFTGLIERLQSEQLKLRLSELYHLILDDTAYVRELRNEATEESMARIENLEEFDSLLLEFEEDFFEVLPKDLSEQERNARNAELLPLFIEQSTLASDTDRLDGLSSTVKMMTLHSSKGLEFPVVFMVGMEEGLFPSIKQWEETPVEDIEEERRLCYVGMTRARELLFLMNVVVRRVWGNVNYQEPSRFFAEMPVALLEVKDFTQSITSGARPSFRLGSSRGFGGGRYGSLDRGDHGGSDDDGPRLAPVSM
ncbi:MAG TPA: UvrD-helicase domain-containing protein, partial [Bdellovibrionota bacterium]|nr:UvrD-helicase domain-containing protein [Bdellovibrionota bacterium]